MTEKCVDLSTLVNRAQKIIDGVNQCLIKSRPINVGDAIRLCVSKDEEGRETVDFSTGPIKGSTKEATYYHFEIRRKGTSKWRMTYISLSAIFRIPLRKCYWRYDDARELESIRENSSIMEDDLMISATEAIEMLRKGVEVEDACRDIKNTDAPNPPCFCYRAL